MRRKHSLLLAIILTFSLLLLLNAPVLAGSCKGLSKSECQSSGSCSWVKGKETSKGKIDSFCSKNRKNAESDSKKDKYKKNRDEKYNDLSPNEKAKMSSQKELKQQGRSLPLDY